jgi:uncharacterized protein (TIGR03067 family)
MIRVVAALIALLALTAFAPAPFPKAARRGGGGDQISLQHFQGKWELVRIEWIAPNGKRSEFKIDSVTVAFRVKGDQWSYLDKGDVVKLTYTITVQEGRGATAIDWLSTGEQGEKLPPFMLGLIKRDGDTVQILGQMGASVDQRPKRWDDPPVGWWLMTLQRSR